MSADVPFRFRKLDHVVLRVSSVPRAIEFYQSVLGCTLERQLDQLGLYQLRAGDALIDLVDVNGEIGRQGGAPPNAAAGGGGCNMDHFCLVIDPFEPEVLQAHLRRHDVDFSEVGRRYGAEGFGPSIYLTDPDGNTVELKGPAEPGTRLNG